jgi:outer membrane immunogenic protein
MIKSLNIAFLCATVALSASIAHAEGVAAAPERDVSYYGTLGYTYLHGSPANISVDLGGITGRLGARYQRYLGVEAEVTLGVADQTIQGVKVSLDSQYAGYVVGYLPVQPNAELFARVGYGNAKLKASYAGASASANGDTWAYGVGGQYFLDAKNGVRVEYTRYASTDSSDADVDAFSVSYVRKF